MVNTRIYHKKQLRPSSKRKFNEARNKAVRSNFSDSFPDYNRVAPPHSYINAGDFDSPKALAKYLHYLDNNDEEYLSYLWWRSNSLWTEVRYL